MAPIFRAWTTRTLVLIDSVRSTLTSQEVQLDPSGYGSLLHRLGRSLADADLTIPEFRAGGSAFELIVQARQQIDGRVLVEARRLAAVPALDRTRLHDKVIRTIDYFESAHRDAHPIRQGLTAPHFGIAPGWLGELLERQTTLSWNDWSIGAHLRDSVRGIVAGCHAIGASATAEWGWSSRHHFYKSFRDLIGVGPHAFRVIVQTPAHRR